ncbi:MAG: hypothetical protein KDD43_03125 [Bdellovibrionales bacterium]|nr:hypothetical protein [Bdellovibrionales bacterium]
MQHNCSLKTKTLIQTKCWGVLTLVLIIFCCGDAAYANRLVQAANSATASMLTLAQATSGIAFALGAIMYYFGASHTGRQILIGGLIGVSATFGGPAIIEALKNIFGV